MMRLGYLIPEFPGQTHIFFWREAGELEKLGIEVRYVSTRRPDRRLRSHDWSERAGAQTAYLFPPAIGLLGRGVLELLRAGPRGWMRLGRAVLEGSPAQLPRSAVLALAGAMLAGLARRDDIRHVHVHSCANAALIAAFANRLSGLSYSLTLHGPLSDYGPLQRTKWRHAAFAIVITRRLMNEVRQELRGFLPPAVDCAPMGVDLAAFARPSPYVAWNGEGPAAIVSVGRLNFVKGHQDAIEAMSILRRRGVPAQLRICGEDEQGGDGFRRTLQSQIDAAGLGEHVVLLGAVSEARVRSEILQAHVFVLASHHEPLGVAIMEAMALGAPVVATEAGGVPELIEAGVDGVLVPPKAPERLADEVQRLLTDPDRARRIAAAGRRKVEASFHSRLSAATIARQLSWEAGGVEQQRRS
jgi:glycosyltransferase involved in cell wall biosynthesis